MKKIIAAFDGLKYSESTKEYAISLAKQCQAHLIGIFLDDFTYHSYKIYDLISEGEQSFESKQGILEKKDVLARATAVADFEAACREAGIEYAVHHDRNIAIQELLHESIYADLLIINSRETLTHYNEKLPTRFIRELLVNVQCPVLVIPQLFRPIDKVVMLYDGKPSSVHALKMFGYTLHALAEDAMEVVSVRPVKQSSHVPDNRLMKEFMKRHFPKAAFTVLNGDPEPGIINYLKKQNANSLVILGAYSRSMVSRWFRESMADMLMRDFKFPLFIAHTN